MKLYNIPKNPKAIIFDIDSTLYTNEDYAYEQVDVQVRHFASLRGISNEAARKMVMDYRIEWGKNNGGKKISLSNTLLAFGIPISESVLWRKNLLEPKNFLQADKVLIEELEKLSLRFKMIAVTNNPVLPAFKTLKALGVEKLIPEIIGLDTCLVSKPAREPFLLAVKKLELASSDCISVGDRYDLDIALPLEMGMGGVLVSGVEDVYTLSEKI